MPFLDVVHILFEPSVATEDEHSIFYKEWQMTLQYVLHQPGLDAAYTTHLSLQPDLWVFLVWDKEDDRSYFYHQTTGFGFMSHHMTKLPSVFFFSDSLYTELNETNQWTISIVSAEAEQAHDLKNDLKGKRMEEFFGSYSFVAQQQKDIFENLYEGNNFNAAVVALTRTDKRAEKKLECRFQKEHYSIELGVCKKIAYPGPDHVEAPLSIAELTRKQPWEYGVLSCDESRYSDTAYPMSLTFQPMSTLTTANKFQSEPMDRPTIEQAAADKYATCVICFELDVTSQLDEDTTEHLRESGKLQDGVQGLRELSILRMIDRKHQIWFLSVWNTSSDLAQWWQSLAIDDNTGNAVIPSCTLGWSWTSNVVGLQKLNWESLPLTADKQSYEAVDKVLEIVEFSFATDLTPLEKEAFLHRLYDLINTMSSCWSGDTDAEPIVYSEDPVWREDTNLPLRCLLFLAWDGTEQRAAWLRNFMAHSFTWTGYIAHTLGLICCGVESRTFKMEKLYTGQSDQATQPTTDDRDDDSDWDMGF
ncbi:hypothetical protein EKO04_002197 [Ascochyta lentis]|uniref:Uncharacterized protein n=1 Tax=Ascochyta lentis TaxID=205686 RepID=A0A8H7JB06_9PLEO|nr:hypothetical protein EKO04_002197 [Ascochyta lentis]